MALSTIKSSGGDFTSLSAWEAATQGDLTGTGAAIAECYDLDDTTPVTITGWTTTASDYIQIIAATIARCNGSTRAQTGNTYRLSGSNSTGQLRIAEEYVRISGIEIKATGAQPALEFPSATISAPSDLRVDDCVLISSDVTASSDYVVRATEAGATITMRNTLVVGKRRGIDTRNSDAVTIDHCTFYGLGADLGLVCDSEATVTNTAAFGYTSQCFWTGGAAPSGSNNAGSDTSVSTDYTSSIPSLTDTNEFTNPTLSDSTFDFSLLSGSSLRDAGVGSFATDIAGASRDASPDIGAFEFVSGGGGQTVTPNLITLSATVPSISITAGVVQVTPNLITDTVTVHNVEMVQATIIGPELITDTVDVYSVNIVTGETLVIPTLISDLASIPNIRMVQDGEYTYTMCSNEDMVGFFRQATGSSSYCLNELAIAYYKQAGLTTAPQFNEALKAAQTQAGFVGLSPTDWRNSL